MVKERVKQLFSRPIQCVVLNNDVVILLVLWLGKELVFEERGEGSIERNTGSS